MKNMTGVKEVASVNSTGKLTLNNVGEIVSLRVKGAANNTVESNFTVDALQGTSDKLNVILDEAIKGADISVNAGFESAELEAKGSGNVLKDLNVPGVESLTIKGEGDLKVENNALDGFTSVTSSLSGNLTLGNMTGVKTLDLSSMTTDVKAINVSSTTGFATDTISLDAGGATVKLGSGNDVLKFSSGTSSGKTDTIYLGSGNDKVEYSKGSGNAVIFGEDGNDVLKVSGSNSFNASDLIDLGEGTDKVVISGTHTLVLN